MLILHQSNRLERLADELAEVLRVPLASPLAPETIAVQSNGMARWLRMRLADRLGIAANLDFPLPSSLVWKLFGRLLPDVPDHSPYDREVLVWRLMGLLPVIADGEAFVALRAYLADAEDDLRRHQLASRIADLFDQYLIYRPDWILDWERGGGTSWHAPLWRELVRSIGGIHRVRVQERFLAALADTPSAPVGLPSRLSLFGIPTLPPAQLAVFARLADHLDVHLFLLNPCRQLWTEIRSEKEIARRAKDRDPQELYLETGNSLLAACGKQGRDFLGLLLDADPHETGEFEEPGEDCLLHCLQTDILGLRNRGADGDPRTPIRPDDQSVQIHSCHGPMREAEALYDQLLALFEADPDLLPGDVAVMTPDVEAYAPFIEAVFGTAEPDRRIPFSIADRRQRTESPIATALFSLLEIVEGRFGADQVLSLLEIEPVRRRFGIAEGELTQIQDWVRAAGVRWGVDRESRAALDLPATAEHTWRAGLDRLLLGFALPGGGRRLFGGILPFDEVEGAAGRTLGRLASFAEALFAARDELSRPRPVVSWADLLVRLLGRFLDADEDEEEQVADIRRAAAALAAEAAQADFAGPVSLAVVRAALQAGLGEGRGGGRFLAGRVTFCAMVPMRSVPFRVVCLIGLNDGSFPRSRRAPGFDLMSDDARTGDRSRRDDDRYLFLEAVISARRVLYLSYVGQSNRDNTPLPPSVLVSELLEYVDRGFVAADGERPLRDRLLTRHPLHAFSPRYFRAGADEPRLFSYSEEFCEASRRRRTSPGPPPFLAQPLAEPAAEWRTVELTRFIRYFQQPTKYLVRERLRIHMEEQEGVLESREPFMLDGLAAYGLRQDLLDFRLTSGSPADAWQVARAGGRLPQGRVGELLYADEAERVEAFAKRLAARRPAERSDPLPVDCPLGPIRLTGWLTGVSSQGLLEYRPTTAKPKDWIALWLRHLLLNALRPPGVSLESCWIGEEETILLGPVADPLPRLSALAETYWAGLSRPLPLFPEAGFAYAERLQKGQGEERALSAARTVWIGSDFSKKTPEGQDPYHRLVFGSRDPLDADFTRLAREVYLPILEHRVP
jgi:exodeoxyribonuclease V gamma subunit